jgi:hypothetical protein
VPQFECWIVASPNGSTQPCRLRSHPDSLGAGKVGSANAPTATAIWPGNPSASQ